MSWWTRRGLRNTVMDTVSRQARARDLSGLELQVLSASGISWNSHPSSFLEVPAHNVPCTQVQLPRVVIHVAV